MLDVLLIKPSSAYAPNRHLLPMQLPYKQPAGPVAALERERSVQPAANTIRPARRKSYTYAPKDLNSQSWTA